MKNSKPKELTVIIHTRNEASNLPGCIASCRKLSADILVVDMGSTDDTLKLATKSGAKILEVENVGFVEPVRQQAINAASTPWILILDADERLPSTLVTKIIQFLKHPDTEIVRIPRKNIMLGKWIQHGLRWPDYQVRLFKKQSLTWPTEVHSQPKYTTELVKDFEAIEANAIEHFHSPSIQILANKTLQQANSERHYDQQNAVTANAVYQRIFQEFPWRFQEHEGYKDGIHGYMSAKFMEYYRFLEFATYWERLGYPEMQIPVVRHQNRVTTLLARVRKERLVRKISGYQKIHGWLSPEEAYGLAYTASLLPLKATVVEIGSWKGKSTICLAKGLKSGTIYAIDPFDASGEPGSKEAYADSKGEVSLLEQFKQNLRQENVLNSVIPLVGFSKDFVKRFKTIDFLFIDGDHSKKGCKYDFDQFSPLVKKGGYLAFHDCRPEMPDLGPTWVIKHHVLPSHQFMEVARFDALWVGQKV